MLRAPGKVDVKVDVNEAREGGMNNHNGDFLKTHNLGLGNEPLIIFIQLEGGQSLESPLHVLTGLPDDHGFNWR